MRGGGAQMICWYEEISIDPLAGPGFGQIGATLFLFDFADGIKVSGWISLYSGLVWLYYLAIGGEPELLSAPHMDSLMWPYCAYIFLYNFKGASTQFHKRAALVFLLLES